MSNTTLDELNDALKAARFSSNVVVSVISDGHLIVSWVSAILEYEDDEVTTYHFGNMISPDERDPWDLIIPAPEQIKSIVRSDGSTEHTWAMDSEYVYVVTLNSGTVIRIEI